MIVHDAARPLATPQLFEQALRALERAPEADAVIAAAPVTDTIKEVAEDGRTVARTLERSRLWAVQTPQVFRRAALERALALADDELARATDDAWLVERTGGVVHVRRLRPGQPEDHHARGSAGGRAPALSAALMTRRTVDDRHRDRL